MTDAVQAQLSTSRSRALSDYCALLAAAPDTSLEKVPQRLLLARMAELRAEHREFASAVTEGLLILGCVVAAVISDLDRGADDEARAALADLATTLGAGPGAPQ